MAALRPPKISGAAGNIFEFISWLRKSIIIITAERRGEGFVLTLVLTNNTWRIHELFCAEKNINKTLYLIQREIDFKNRDRRMTS